MMDEINHAQDFNKQLLTEIVAKALTMNDLLQEKWLDYGTGLADGYKLARRRDESQKKEG